MTKTGGKIFEGRHLLEAIGRRERSEESGNLEARVGIEPTYKGFADLSLTTWVPRLAAS